MLVTVHPGLRYIWIEILLFVHFVTMRVQPFPFGKEDTKMGLPHAILFCCYGEWRYGRHRVREKRTAGMQAHGVEESPKYSIKAVVLIQANCPAFQQSSGTVCTERVRPER